LAILSTLAQIRRYKNSLAESFLKRIIGFYT